MQAEKTIVQQLAEANDALKALSDKAALESKSNADKITALEKSVAGLTAERDTLKATADKATADLKVAQEQAQASAKTAGELTDKIKGLESRLADPSFKAASTPGSTPVPEGGKEADPPKTLKQLEAAYVAETSKTNPDINLLAELRKQIFAEQNKSK